jgi:microcystin-dependent protein
MFGGNFPPSGWMVCNGQTLPISEYETLFNLIGTTYGGDGQSTFQLPGLGGRVPIHQGQGAGLSNYFIGQSGGVEDVTLTIQQIPNHMHPLLANTTSASASTPAANTILATENVNNGTNNPYTYVPYNAATPNQVTMPNSSIAQTGGSQPHSNVQPVLALTYVISLFGVYPTQ